MVWENESDMIMRNSRVFKYSGVQLADMGDSNDEIIIKSGQRQTLPRVEQHSFHEKIQKGTKLE